MTLFMPGRTRAIFVSKSPLIVIRHMSLNEWSEENRIVGYYVIESVAVTRPCQLLKMSVAQRDKIVLV
jgi:hypothetical protein